MRVYPSQSLQISSSVTNLKVKGKGQFQLGENGLELDKKILWEGCTVSQMISDAVLTNEQKPLIIARTHNTQVKN